MTDRNHTTKTKLHSAKCLHISSASQLVSLHSQTTTHLNRGLQSRLSLAPLVERVPEIPELRHARVDHPLVCVAIGARGEQLREGLVVMRARRGRDQTWCENIVN